MFYRVTKLVGGHLAYTIFSENRLEIASKLLSQTVEQTKLQSMDLQQNMDMKILFYFFLLHKTILIGMMIICVTLFQAL